ncbi:MAG: L-serine ammonia-lyase, iron-sulfur-dependent subunit beta [Eubacteriales bacterium]|nr:L-serine ammonia-lyase, iron-sulfur-dependent subunit beta [Eubacteriales bacterium]
MPYRSVFEIIGPVMIGPSSSHTAGAVRLGQLARGIFGEEPGEITVRFYGSFAQTYRGHATDVAVVAGLLNFQTDDARIPDSLEHARERGISVSLIPEADPPQHPNTLAMELANGANTLRVTGVSLGGGAVRLTELEGFPLNLTGENPAILILHLDTPGVVAAVTARLAQNEINISHMGLSRRGRGKVALMVIETDQAVPKEVAAELMGARHVIRVALLQG